MLALVIRLKIYLSLLTSVFPQNGPDALSHIVRSGGGVLALRQVGELKVLTLVLRIDSQRDSFLLC